MPSPRPIDPALGEAFRVAEARGAGYSPRRLRSADLATPFHGVRTTRPMTPAAAYAPRLRPGDRYSHTTAAALWGAPLPRAHESALHVSATRRTRPRTRGCIGHESAPVAPRIRHGLPVSGPARTLLECGSLLLLDDLVAVADHLLLDPHVLDPADLRPYATREGMLAYLASSRGPGVRLARRALALAREGVESPMETRLRLILQRAGMTAPSCGYELARPDRSAVGWFDLAWPEQKVLVEYDGDQHRTSTWQYEKDIRRFDEAAELGWRVVRVRSHGILTDPAGTVNRVRGALA